MDAPFEVTAAAAPPRRLYGRVAAAVVVSIVGLAITGIVTWSVRSDYMKTESRLLTLQTKQAIQVLNSATESTGAPLQALAEGAMLTHGSAASFVQESASEVGAHGYADVSLWDDTGGTLRDVVTTGLHPQLSPGSARASELVAASRSEGTFAVLVHFGSPRRIGYLYASRGSPYVVYVEDRLPSPGHSTLKQNQAFSDLGFAIYLGRAIEPRTLLVVADATVPIRGDVTVQRARFGTTYLTLVATAAGPLAGSLSRDLPWIFGTSGVVLTLLAALAAQQLVRGRRLAEADASRSRELADVVAHLYQEQRTIAETLQRSLLPVRNPHVEGVEVASRYVAGGEGVEIGGDWYSLLAIDGPRYGFVVGDVSGRGFVAATVMAALRYTTRTLLLEDHELGAVLERTHRAVGEQFRGHFATVLVGKGDASRHELVLATAGHPPPLRLLDGSADFVELPVGVPLGVDGGRYETVRIATPPGCTLLAFTDGLVERRRENLSVGLERLRTAASHASGDLETMLDSVIDEVAGRDAEDDIAILALRFR